MGLKIVLIEDGVETTVLELSDAQQAAIAAPLADGFGWRATLPNGSPNPISQDRAALENALRVIRDEVKKISVRNASKEAAIAAQSSASAQFDSINFNFGD